MVQTASLLGMHALGQEFDSVARLLSGNVWTCLWDHALKRSPGINRKSRVLCPGPGFLSSATLPSMPKEHFNGLIDRMDAYKIWFKTNPTVFIVYIYTV